MFARAVFSFHPARPHAPNKFPSKSFLSPTYKNSPRNFFVSPTYAKTGVYPSKNVGLSRVPSRGAPTFSHSFLTMPTLGPLAFQSVAHSFVFRIPPISRPSYIFRTLASKTGGAPLPGHVWPRADRTRKNRPPRKAAATNFLYLINLVYLLYFLLFHSPAIYNSVTAPSPNFLPDLSQ